MKKRFPGHYLPAAPFDEVLKEALVIFDTNVLLNFYDLGPSTRSRSFNTLREIKDRCWIPYHVALEFHRHRVGRVERAVKNHREAVKGVNKAIGDITQSIERQDVLKNDETTTRLVQDFKTAGKALVDHAENAASQLPQRSSEDPVNEYLAELFDDRVGPPPTQEDINSLNAQGQRRYDHGHPPGITDAAEKANQKFMDRDVIYSGKFGDLYIWMQMLEIAKAMEGKKHLIFVTDERKQDWWAKDGSNLLGPAPELVQELALIVPGWKLWMYGSPRFFELLSGTAAAKLSNEDLDEIREVSEAQEASIRGAIKALQAFNDGMPKVLSSLDKLGLRIPKPEYQKAVRALRIWLQSLKKSPTNFLNTQVASDNQSVVFSEMSIGGEVVHKYSVFLLNEMENITKENLAWIAMSTAHAAATEGVGGTIIYDISGLDDEMGEDVISTMQLVFRREALTIPLGDVYVTRTTPFGVVTPLKIA